MMKFFPANLIQLKTSTSHRFLIKKSCSHLVMAIVGFVFLASCNTLEKASLHGLNSGYYTFEADTLKSRSVYLDVTDEKIYLYSLVKNKPDKKQVLTIPLLATTDSLVCKRMVFKKQSLDIDITSILFKYRPTVFGLPAQVTTDLNMALYVGWRNDCFKLQSKKDPLGRNNLKMRMSGYDFGFFAGPGATLISPFTTQNKRLDEYNGMIIQTGIAAFIESNMASFGLAAGYDYLMSSDRKIWIYTNKPWIGFVVGIALN